MRAFLLQTNLPENLLYLSNKFLATEIVPFILMDAFIYQGNTSLLVQNSFVSFLSSLYQTRRGEEEKKEMLLILLSFLSHSFHTRHSFASKPFSIVFSFFQQLSSSSSLPLLFSSQNFIPLIPNLLQSISFL